MNPEIEATNLPLNGKIRVVFMIKRATLDPTVEHVYIVGSVPELGGWDVACAKQTGYSGLNSWIVEAFFEPNSEVDFKLCLVCHPSRDQLSSGDVTPTLVQREEGWFRRLRLTSVPVSVHVTYNRPEIVATALRSDLTVDGQPWCFQEGNDGHTAGRRSTQGNAAEIQKVATDASNDAPGVYTDVVHAGHILDEVLLDTSSLRSSWAHMESAVSEGEDRKGDSGDRKGKGRRERKKRWKKKRKATLRMLLKKYGIEKNQNETVDGDKMAEVEVVSNMEVMKNMKEEIPEQATDNAGSADWKHAIKMAAPVGFGLGVAAATLYFWFKQK